MLNVDNSQAIFLPSELLEAFELENLANRYLADKSVVVQLDLFQDEGESKREQHLIEQLGNYLVYG